jgi:hypothetical protein
MIILFKYIIQNEYGKELILKIKYCLFCKNIDAPLHVDIPLVIEGKRVDKIKL